MRRTAAIVVIAAVPMSGACYQYVPIDPGAVVPNQDVRVRITPDAAARLTKDLGVYSMELDGQFSPHGPDSVSVGVPIDRAYQGTRVETTTQQLMLGRREVIDVRKREFSRGRTVLVSAGAVVGFALAAKAVKQLGDPNPPDDSHPPPPPVPIRIPSGFHFGLRIQFP